MARRKFLGTTEDRIITPAGAGIVGERIGFWLDPARSNRVTDLTTPDGTSIVELTTDQAGYPLIADGTPVNYIFGPATGLGFMWMGSLDNASPLKLVTTWEPGISADQKGVAGGVATLDGSGVVEQQIAAGLILGQLDYSQLPDHSIYPTTDQVPSLEETFVSVTLGNPAGGHNFPDTRSREVPVLSAPFPLTILSAHLLCNARIEADPSNYWTLNLFRGDTSATPDNHLMASKSSADQTIRRDVGWPFDVLFDPTHRHLGVNETMHFQPVPTGSPGDLAGPNILTVRYARQ